MDLYASGVFPHFMGGGRQKHVSALVVAVVIRPPEAGKPQADLKTTHPIITAKCKIWLNQILLSDKIVAASIEDEKNS